MLVCLIGSAACGGTDGSHVRLREVSADYLANARQSATDEQLSILADGMVTFAEYEQSVLSTVSCIEQTGAMAIGPELKFQGKWYVYSARTSSEVQVPGVQRCLARGALIENTWSLEIQATEQEIQVARTALIQCLNDRGLTVPKDASSDRLAGLASSSIYRECSDKIGEELGFRG